MDQTRKARLEAGGIMVDEALERFMGNEAMLERYLQKFLSEKSYVMLRDSLASNDWEAAGRAAHTLKSVCGTIGCEAMQELVILQERHIRAGETDKQNIENSNKTESQQPFGYFYKTNKLCLYIVCGLFSHRIWYSAVAFHLIA